MITKLLTEDELRQKLFEMCKVATLNSGGAVQNRTDSFVNELHNLISDIDRSRKALLDIRDISVRVLDEIKHSDGNPFENAFPANIRALEFDPSNL